MHQIHQHRPAPRQAPQPPPPQQPLPNYGVVVHEQPTRSIEGITVPLLLVFSFALFLVGATYMATTQFNNLQNSVERLAGKIEEVADKIRGRIERIEKDAGDNLTLKDHQLWCASAERANRNIGWACTEHPAPLPATPPTVKGWRTTLK